MADLWYYTSAGKPMEPVTIDELKQLAVNAILKPNDLVWQEGMPDWVQAGSRPELFPAREEEIRSRPAVSKPSRQVEEVEEIEEAKSPIRSRKQTRSTYENEADFGDGEDDRPRRRRPGGQGPGGVIIALLCVGGLILALLIGGVTYLAMRDDGLASGTRTFNLKMNEKAIYNITFHAGKKVEIWVQSVGNSDVDLYVFDSKDFKIVFDDGPSKDCYVTFVPSKTQSYKIEVWNRMWDARIPQMVFRNGPNNGTVRYAESEPFPGQPAFVPQPAPVQPAPEPRPAPQEKERPTNQLPIKKQAQFPMQPIQPPPPVIIPPVQQPPIKPALKRPFPQTWNRKEVKGQLATTDAADPQRPGCFCKLYSISMLPNKTYTIYLSADFDCSLRLEGSKGAELGKADGINQQARIVYRPMGIEINRIYVSSSVPNVTGNFTLKASP